MSGAPHEIFPADENFDKKEGEDLNLNGVAVPSELQGSGVSSPSSVQYVDAQNDTVQDLNDALVNNDGAALHNGLMTIDASVEIPQGKTLYIYGRSGFTVESGLGVGSLNTQDTNGGNTTDAIVDARGNDNCGIVVLGGRLILDANIAGDKNRMHGFFANSRGNYVLGPFETRGGRTLWAWDVVDGRFVGGRHDHANDPNNQGSTVMAAEGCEQTTWRDFRAKGDTSATPNMKEVIDLNGAGRDNTVENVVGIDLQEQAVDCTGEAGTTIRDVKRLGGGTGEPGTIELLVNGDASTQFSSKTRKSADGLEAINITRIAPSGATDAAIALVKQANGATAKDVKFENVTAINCPLLDYFTYNSPTEDHTIRNLHLEGTSRNSGGKGVVKSGGILEKGWHLDITVDSPAGDGAVLESLPELSGAITVDGAGGDGVVADNLTRSSLSAVLTDNTGYGVRAKNGSDKNRYDGVIDGNGSGQSTGTGASSVIDAV